MSKILQIAERVINIEIEAIQNLLDHLDGEFEKAIDALNETLNNKGKIIVLGIGKSGNIGHKIAATLNSTGATAVVLNSQNALHGDLGIISDGDTVITLSYSGETTELLDLLPFIKRFNVTMISITKSNTSTLATHSDITLRTPILREACPLNLAPTSSSTAALVMGDALAMTLLESRGFTEKDFAKFHPGGSLGRALLTKVSEIMRTGVNLATVAPEATITEALDAMRAARTGACVIRNPDNTLAGIFTHGDFARAFQTDNNIGNSPVTDHHTKEPITIQANSLAAHALQILSQNRIDDLVVLDHNNKITGLIDSQDLARLKIV